MLTDVVNDANNVFTSLNILMLLFLLSPVSFSLLSFYCFILSILYYSLRSVCLNF